MGRSGSVGDSAGLVVAHVADAAHPGPQVGADSAAERLRFEKSAAPSSTVSMSAA